jgi:hypothetical protein
VPSGGNPPLPRYCHGGKLEGIVDSEDLLSQVLVLTGPPGAGTDAAAELLARRMARAAVIDAELLHTMIAVGRRHPWEGDAGRVQAELGARNACALATNFVAAGYTPIVCELLTDETAALYRSLLAPVRVMIVLLLPSFDAVRQRNASRTPPFAENVLRALYESQRQLSEFDHLLDNTNLTASAVAERLSESLRQT